MGSVCGCLPVVSVAIASNHKGGGPALAVCLRTTGPGDLKRPGPEACSPGLDKLSPCAAYVCFSQALQPCRFSAPATAASTDGGISPATANHATPRGGWKSR